MKVLDGYEGTEELGHYACRNGETAGCRKCGFTGQARIAFVYEITGHLKRDLDELVDSYASVRHGRDTKRSGHVIPVLQHCIDREAFDTVWRLGGLMNVFAFFCQQEAEHCMTDEELERT